MIFGLVSLCGHLSFASTTYDTTTTIQNVGCQNSCYLTLPSNPNGCLYAVAYEPDTSTMSQARHALALAAYMAGKSIRINYTKNATTNICTVNLIQM